ncbi:hypothetical protein [Streptomyces odonnellii]|uniref:hypothetical protein n=1 Tax=Streptomyces odonnellii TaxID=1417980 RepID=UPI00069667E1|nr:hypothetical protein [Streptomyces odonnellii]
MARIQVLELPMSHVGDATETPFVLVIDQAEVQRHVLGVDQPGQGSYWDTMGQKIGVRAVIVTPDTLDVI